MPRLLIRQNTQWQKDFLHLLLLPIRLWVTLSLLYHGSD